MYIYIAGPFTLENHIHVKALKCKVVQINNYIDALLNPYLKTAPKQFSKGVPHEWPRYSII